MEIVKSLLCLTIIKCYCVIYSKSEVINITLGDPGKELFVENGQPLLIHCILNSGNLDSSQARSWLADTTTLINDGNPTSAGSGYSETLDTDKFSLSTPPMDLNADGRVYRCNYIFSQTTVTVRINSIGSYDQSKGTCINGKSIKDCWFSLSKVIPGVSSSNLTVTYIDDMEENITSMLNESFQMNADGKTRDYRFNIVQTLILLKNVKAITLSFMVGSITTSRTITVEIEDCKLEIRLFGSLPVSLCVPITSIVIIILLILKKEPFFKHFGELTKKKVLIIILFILVAIIIGLCLGLLIEGICDNKYLALGLSFLFAILLAVALILILLYYHKKFESKKDIQDGGAQDGNGSSQNNTGSNTTRTTTERVGSPASTSNVELAAKNKAGVPKGEQSALKQKEINTPLPLPPSGNSQYLTASTNNLPVSRNKLDPIVMENEEPNPSERKKKKRKKKKRKNEKNVDEAGDNED